MTCVGYEEDFIRILVRNVDRYVPPPKKKRKQTAASSEEPSQSRRKKSKGTGSKRKPIDVDLPSVESDAEPLPDGRSDVENINAGTMSQAEVPVGAPAVDTTNDQRRSTRPRVKRVRNS